MLTKEQEHKAQMKILEQMRIDLEKAQALENHKKAQEGMRKYCIPYRICLDYYKAPFNDEVVRLNPCYPLPGYEIDKCIKEYLEKVIHLIEDNFSYVIDNMDNLLFVGGGAALLSKYQSSIRPVIDKYYNGDFVIIPKNPEHYNVVGYYMSI